MQKDPILLTCNFPFLSFLKKNHEQNLLVDGLDVLIYDDSAALPLRTDLEYEWIKKPGFDIVLDFQPFSSTYTSEF